jgi:hypothetical protein
MAVRQTGRSPKQFRLKLMAAASHEVRVSQLMTVRQRGWCRQSADSGDGDHLFRSIVITGSGDRDHAQGGYGRPLSVDLAPRRLARRVVARIAGSGQGQGRGGDRSTASTGSPARDAECPPVATQRRAREGPGVRWND